MGEVEMVYGLLGCVHDDPILSRFIVMAAEAAAAGAAAETDDDDLKDGGGEGANVGDISSSFSKASFTASSLGNRPPCVYHNYRGLGLSLCFEASLLRALHVYNGTHGYAIFPGLLPHGLRSAHILSHIPIYMHIYVCVYIYIYQYMVVICSSMYVDGHEVPCLLLLITTMHACALLVLCLCPEYVCRLHMKFHVCFCLLQQCMHVHCIDRYKRLLIES